MKLTNILSAIILVGSAVAIGGAAYAERTTGRGNPTAPVVFVTSQGLYYDSIVVVDPLPQKGNFQQLIPGPNGLETEFGPGQPGHLGGRWWIDLNGNSIMDPTDKYFLCPLLGPGRTTL